MAGLAVAQPRPRNFRSCGLDKCGAQRQRAGNSLLWQGFAVKRPVEFPLEQGGSVLVEVDEPPAGPAMLGLGTNRPSVTEQADKRFEEATAAVTPAAVSLLARLRSRGGPLDEIGIEFGVQLSAQTGAFVASVAAGANFKVTMTWRGAPGT